MAWLYGYVLEEFTRLSTDRSIIISVSRIEHNLIYYFYDIFSVEMAWIEQNMEIEKLDITD